ncbi:MAG TPA: SDR family NAD(P)-dependent oxidoreductase [Terriglobales bacterium]|nr:SDR family NAD(P)-dependent oxidoreductase [Terriglobales bacterium]
MPISISLEGKVALITGGSRGIGAATVRAFVAAGAQVAFNYQKAKSKAEALAQELGAQCVPFESDLSKSENSKVLVEAVVKRFGRLDVLVANHGVWPAEDISIDQMAEAQWQNTIAVNLESVFGLIKYSVAQMKRQKTPAHIVLVSSTSGQRGEAFHCDYSATKGALISMVKGLSTELARDRIYVNCVAPGWVDTDMVEPALADPKTREAIFRTIPMGRVGTPEEIAMPILFLCSPYAGFITGEVFNVNGGAVLTG